VKARKAPIKGPKREPLNRQKIAEAALAFIDANGLEELSTRRLGAQLGVEGMALYKHYPSKEALLDAVAEKLILQVDVPPKELGSWQDRVRAFGRAFRNLSRRHPKAYPLLAMRRFITPQALAQLDRLVGAILDEGFPPPLAVELFRALNNYCNGACLDELAGYAHAERTQQAPPEPPEVPLQNLARVAPWLGPEHFDALFESGLSVVIEGFDRKLKAQGR
jgi:AcrR family transcriptional regulator